jgi:hypothetical protein
MWLTIALARVHTTNMFSPPTTFEHHRRVPWSPAKEVRIKTTRGIFVYNSVPPFGILDDGGERRYVVISAKHCLC